MSRWLNLSKKHGLLSFNQCQQSLTLIARVQMAFPSSLKTRGETQVERFSCHPHALCLPPTPLRHSKHERRGFVVVVFLPLRSSKGEWSGFFVTHMPSSCHQPPITCVFEQRSFLVTWHMPLACCQPLSVAWNTSRGVFSSPTWPFSATNHPPLLDNRAEGFFLLIFSILSSSLVIESFNYISFVFNIYIYFTSDHVKGAT